MIFDCDTQWSAEKLAYYCLCAHKLSLYTAKVLRLIIDDHFTYTLAYLRIKLLREIHC